ncbi:hypothetical protein HYU07_07205 [Candidatus Woesearchaeota archaeon]|nr:hypothetical protein [Candidatus Woesearchaeota archaeon]
MKKIKAVALLSGGLDSSLAVKLIKDQGIDVHALNCTSIFCLCNTRGRCESAEVAKKFKIPIKMIKKGMEYIKIVRNPKHGYGSSMNPCIDCRIYLLKKAKKYAKEVGAKFIFTGEVLDQRPMSQHFNTLMLIEKESGLKGKLLRPLSAKLLPETEAEKKGWVKRDLLLAIKGRQRKEQIELAKKLNFSDYPCPSGGCLLTDKCFGNKIRDLFDHKKTISMNDLLILKYGRHFRFNGSKIIVGRNEMENKELLRLKNKSDYYFEVPDCGSPVTILQDKKTKDAIKLAAQLTARYSDAKNDEVLVKYGISRSDKEIAVNKIKDEQIDKFFIK